MNAGYCASALLYLSVKAFQLFMNLEFINALANGWSTSISLDASEKKLKNHSGLTGKMENKCFHKMAIEYFANIRKSV